MAEAHHVLPTAAAPEGTQALAVILEMSGDAWFQGAYLALFGDHEDGPTERRDYQTRFGKAVRKAVSSGTEDSPALVFDLTVDRATSWGRCAWLCSVWAKQELQAHHIRFGVTRWDWREHQEHVAAQVHRSSPSADTTPGLSLQFSLHGWSRYEDRFVRLTAEGTSLDFPIQPRLEFDEAFVTGANRVWKQVAAAVATRASPGGVANIQMEGPHARVPWGYVVALVDILIDLGVRDIHFPGPRLRLVFADMPSVPEPQAVSFVNDSGMGLGAILGILAVLAIASLGVVGVGRSRGRRRRPDRRTAHRRATPRGGQGRRRGPPRR